MMLLALALAASFCDESAAAIDAARAPGADAFDRYERALATFPPASSPVVASSRALFVVDQPSDAALDVLVVARRAACRAAPAVDAQAAREKARAILAGDPRFTGARDDDDAIDRFFDRLYDRLAALLESRGMQAFAGSARAIYFGLLVLVAAWGAWRVLRGRRSVRADAARAHDDVVEHARIRAFADWRAQAQRSVQDGDARAALYAGRMALLARLGEVATGAVTPARTHREILDRLDGVARDVVAAPLAAFDRGYYGGDVDVARAQAFLSDVDGAERRLGRAP